MSTTQPKETETEQNQENDTIEIQIQNNSHQIDTEITENNLENILQDNNNKDKSGNRSDINNNSDNNNSNTNQENTHVIQQTQNINSSHNVNQQFILEEGSSINQNDQELRQQISNIDTQQDEQSSPQVIVSRIPSQEPQNNNNTQQQQQEPVVPRNQRQSPSRPRNNNFQQQLEMQNSEQDDDSFRMDPLRLNINDLEEFLNINKEKNSQMKNIIKKINTSFNTTLIVYILILMNFTWQMPLYLPAIFVIIMEVVQLVRSSIEYSDKYLLKSEFYMIKVADLVAHTIFVIIFTLSNLEVIKKYSPGTIFLALYYLVSIIINTICTKKSKYFGKSSCVVNVILKTLVGAQALLFSFKEDNYISIEWRDVFTPCYVLITLSLVLALFALFVFAFKYFQDCREPDNLRLNYEKYGYFWILVMVFGLTINTYFFIRATIEQQKLADLGLSIEYEEYSEQTQYQQSILRILNQQKDGEDFTDYEYELINQTREKIFVALFFSTFYIVFQIIVNIFVNDNLILFFRDIYFEDDDLFTQEELFQIQMEFNHRLILQETINNHQIQQRRKIKKVKKKVLKEEDVENQGMPQIVSKLSSTYYKVILGMKNKQPKKSGRQPRKKQSNKDVKKNESNQDLDVNLGKDNKLNIKFKSENIRKRKKKPTQNYDMESSNGTDFQGIHTRQNTDAQLITESKDKGETYLMTEGLNNEELYKAQKKSDHIITLRQQQQPLTDRVQSGDGGLQIEDVSKQNQTIVVHEDEQVRTHKESIYSQRRNSVRAIDQSQIQEHIDNNGVNMSKMSDENNCCLVCFCEEPNSLFQPCGHGGICYQCAVDLLLKNQQCYLCRDKITEILKVEKVSSSIVHISEKLDQQEQLFKIITKTRVESKLQTASNSYIQEMQQQEQLQEEIFN